MTVHVKTTIVCDRCGTDEFFGQSEVKAEEKHQVRVQLSGWAVLTQRFGETTSVRHFCSKCSEIINEALK